MYDKSYLTIELERLKKSKQITLRDQFAMAALQGLMSAVNDAELPLKTEDIFKVFAKSAYKFSDAMLAERNKKC